MKVLKFGGTSVGTIESLRNVKAIVESCNEPVIVVVSALGGLTDKLIATAQTAASGGNGYQASLNEIIERHHNVINGIVPENRRKEVTEKANVMLSELSDIYRGLSLIKDLSTHSLDVIVSYGERLSSTIISYIITDATLCDSLQFIKTTNQFGKHVLDENLTDSLIHHKFDNLDYKVALCPGFIATDANGDITNLGRGGSDYTAAILAAALNADSLEIWTDVDGFMTADPRIIKNTHVIDGLSFIEAMELCNFGAKVIYPPTIYPVFHKNIPIYIKNTFNPGAKGTRISDDASTSYFEQHVKGLSSVNDTCLITISSHSAENADKTNDRILNTLARNGITLLLVSDKISGNGTSFAVREADAQRAIDALNTEFNYELETNDIATPQVKHNLATVALVGDNMRGNDIVNSKLYETLSLNGIDVIAVAQGTSETTISFVIELKNQRKALSVIHNIFF